MCVFDFRQAHGRQGQYAVRANQDLRFPRPPVRLIVLAAVVEGEVVCSAQGGGALVEAKGAGGRAIECTVTAITAIPPTGIALLEAGPVVGRQSVDLGGRQVCRDHPHSSIDIVAPLARGIEL
jgi:hypothetical protein